MILLHHRRLDWLGSADEISVFSPLAVVVAAAAAGVVAGEGDHDGDGDDDRLRRA